MPTVRVRVEHLRPQVESSGRIFNIILDEPAVIKRWSRGICSPATLR
jgi:hypothetical protein